ncbi:hypothetical protein EZ449_07080 [Pedobacter frigidisoli]|uniref:Por secretion system C-terminal sorting domain-containing protein n=1 Tax=Pedobacter frigidisoli TaxID=2530455 RepID=A0A4R0P322_9SPHI|nr:hypothetical protein [Pedobacter frigidisoli]TCD11245.1 hypothetical protein EZ449_07080 [Pedobacter frigidisoli]
MKSIFKIAVIAAISLSSTIAQANDDDFSLKAKSEKEKTISFVINEANDFSMSIFGENNEVLFEQKLYAVASSTKTYDLNALPDGTYKMKVESGSKLAQYDVTIYNNMAVFSAPKVTELHRPVITLTDDVITLNFEQTKKNPIAVQVLNDSNDELYSEVFKDKSKLNKKFNVSRADGKALTFVVKYDNDETFVKTIETR